MKFRIGEYTVRLTTIALVLAVSTPLTHAQELGSAIRVDVRTTLQALMADEDTDGDKRITVDDPHITGTERGDRRFWIAVDHVKRFEVVGTYYLSNLLQELKLAEEAGLDTALIRAEKIFEAPTDRISRMVREFYWDGLTRRIDEKGLLTILSDEKSKSVDGFNYLYVAASDKLAHDYYSKISKQYPDWKLKVVRLPDKITGTYVRTLDGRHGLLTLGLRREPNGTVGGLPFVVPGGRFNEMYGWDSYFIVLGLLEDGRIDLAQSMVDNFVYEINHFGAILNANRTYYLTRSQPPFLTSMAIAVYEHLPSTAEREKWLKGVIEAAVREYYGVWTNPDRMTPIGLSRYYDTGFGPPPEVEPGHFDVVFAAFAKRHKMSAELFEEEYRKGKIRDPELDTYFIHDRCMRESGHDTSYRLEGRCADLVTVDLNSLLYKIESDIAHLIKHELGGTLRLSDGSVEDAATWERRAEQRKLAMHQFLWDPERGMFFDYNHVEGKRLDYESATTFYPLWAGLASAEQAAALTQNALPLFEVEGGVVSSTEWSRGPITAERPLRQWDYPHGWAPHQMLVWQGFLNYGYDAIARRLAYRWLFSITLNAVNYNGTVPEKFDLVNRTHQVFAEYGNVGTKFAYITREGFGWTNASYQVGLSLLPPDLRQHLSNLVPPEWIF